MIGGQALIEGIMMRGPDKDAVVVRGKDGLTVEVTPRKLPKKNSPLKWPLIRGVYNFLGSNVVPVSQNCHCYETTAAPPTCHPEPKAKDLAQKGSHTTSPGA